MKIPSDRKIHNAGCFSAWLRNDGIGYSLVTAGSEVNLEDAEAGVEIIRSLDKGRQIPIIVDIRRIKSISKEARKHFAADRVRPSATAVGLLISSSVSRVIGNFFVQLNKPKVPTRIFNRPEEASEWLSRYK